MGSNDGDADEKPVHQVSVKSFEMARTEVTVAQYRKCMEAEVCTRPHWEDKTCSIWNGTGWSFDVLPESFRGDDQPIVCVDHEQENTYAKWVGGRLPTEAEWEYAARSAGKDDTYPWGNAKATCKRAVFSEDGDGCGHNSTWPVCSKDEGNTEQGLCDMAGNVWEDTQDMYQDSYEDTPVKYSTSARNVCRGGSWYNFSSSLRATGRGKCEPDGNGMLVGFRPVRSIR
jgi:formylglycine-generating enzyme required for sulfatase activity